MKSTEASEVDKPKYYEELEEIFGNKEIIHNSSEVMSGLTEFQSSSSDVHFHFLSAASKEKDFVHIKNEHPIKEVAQTKNPISSQDKTLADQAENSHKMNDYKVTTGTHPQLSP